MNKIRRVAEQLVERYPALFSTDFEKNKQALSTVSIVHTRSLRNQLAGAITKLVREKGPTPEEETSGAEPSESLLEERLSAESKVSVGENESSEERAENLPENSTERDSRAEEGASDSAKQTISESAAV